MAFFKDLVNRLTKKQEPAEQKEPVKQEPEKPVISGSTVGKIVKVNAADTTSGADILRELDAISQKLAAMTFTDPVRTGIVQNLAMRLQDIRSEYIAVERCPFDDFDRLIVSTLRVVPNLCQNALPQQIEDMANDLHNAIKAHSLPAEDVARYVLGMEVQYYTIMLIELEGKKAETQLVLKDVEVEYAKLTAQSATNPAALQFMLELNPKKAAVEQNVKDYDDQILGCRVALMNAKQAYNATGPATEMSLAAVAEKVKQDATISMQKAEEHKRQLDSLTNSVSDLTNQYREHMALMEAADEHREQLAQQTIKAQQAMGFDIQIPGAAPEAQQQPAQTAAAQPAEETPVGPMM